MPISIVWFRRDLRLADNAALDAAARRGVVVPVFIWDDRGDGSPGAASRWWLHRSLASLDQLLRKIGSRLVIRSGDAKAELHKLIDEIGADAVYANRAYDPGDALPGVKQFSGPLLFDPGAGEVMTQIGKPYQVFTPFYRACMKRLSLGKPVGAPKTLAPPPRWPTSLGVDDLQLQPSIDWDVGLRRTWDVSEAAAHKRLRQFIRSGVAQYDARRNLPGVDGTSMLSPYLAWGQISPREVWHALRRRDDAEPFRRQLIWREFAHHLLHHFPHTVDCPLRESFARFPWVSLDDEAAARHFRAWRQGRTGYPVVDAGMRQLWRTGWMHNRVRMIVGSFLVKDLRIHWLEGARWFWDTLVDADLANNTLGWQWIAGCGADAAPYFRIFNPELQSRKFDPTGEYVKRWYSELVGVPAKHIHNPPSELRVRVGYPAPIVDHAQARDEALAAYERMKRD